MPEFFEVSQLDQIPPGTATTVTAADIDIALFNVGGTIYATNDQCLHRGGSLGFGTKLEGKIVTCRLHGWKYDVTNGSMTLSPSMKLACYPVKVEDGKIFVQV